MENVSILKFSLSQINWIWFVPSECQQNLLHSNRQTWLHNHKLRSLIWNLEFWFPDSPKTCYRPCKVLTSKLFFLRSYQTIIFHQAPNGKVPARGSALKKKTLFGLSQKRNWLKVLRNFNLLTHIEIQTCSAP